MHRHLMKICFLSVVCFSVVFTIYALQQTANSFHLCNMVTTFNPEDNYFTMVKEDNQKIKQKILELRKQLRYKFALDFLLRYRPEDYEQIVVDSSAFHDPVEIHVSLEKNLGEGILEQFILGDTYSLFKVRSFNSDREYFMLVDSAEGMIGGLSLLANDTTRWRLLDSFDFRGHGGRFKFEKLNGLSIIKSIRPGWGTGYYLEDEAYLSIIRDKFKVLFTTRRFELTSSEKQNHTCTLRNISFTDLNRDGFVDIVEEEKIKRLDDNEYSKIYGAVIKNKDLGESLTFKSEEVVWERVNKFYWNNKIFLFEKGK